MSEYRKMVSWRLSNLSETDQQKINEWADNQHSIQDSLTSLVKHYIERFGSQNVLEYEVQKQLYADSELVRAKTTTPPAESNDLNKSKQKPKHPSNSISVNKNKDDEDMYGQVDINNL
ncbi:hypothetical protein [Rossellomorea yichunensis]|uniref:hypothetical protein n=1 Tax=Rossellomorea yichunensis TaxID=3077331 RepID=UPI0028DDEE56|nr:hypothetical protein [Rossellomorea sp. YC4-1]MDT9027803.1 hypothetical protein [Rossellomorea sp. YC4-1]